MRTGASGHAWVSVDSQCHLHYEIIVGGLSRADDLTVNVHLHGLAEIGEIDDSSAAHKRLLTGFYGSKVGRGRSREGRECGRTFGPSNSLIFRLPVQAQGVLKDISTELLQHLSMGTAFIQVSTKMNPRGEIRGQVRHGRTLALVFPTAPLRIFILKE